MSVTKLAKELRKHAGIKVTRQPIYASQWARTLKDSPNPVFKSISFDLKWAIATGRINCVYFSADRFFSLKTGKNLTNGQIADRLAKVAYAVSNAEYGNAAKILNWAFNDNSPRKDWR